jgi:hypothetical protein
VSPPRSEHWKQEPDDHDYPAAQSYLSLVTSTDNARLLVAALQASALMHYKAKDILRASRLPPLDKDNVHVAGDLDKVHRGHKLSPVLLVRGDLQADTALTIADGYHRICASHLIDEDADIPCHIVDFPETS